MDNRRPPATSIGELADEARRSCALNANSRQGLKGILRRTRGWACDIRAVALDDQSGKLHLPLLEKPDRRPPSPKTPAGELVVSRVEEFLFEGGTSRSRWVELDGLAYEPATGRLTIASDGRSLFSLTVEALDVTLRIRPQTRPHS